MKSLIALPVVAGLLVGILLAQPTVARTWYILPDGSGDASTVQAGIDSAVAGDIVEVACGTYYEHDIVMKSGVILRSETGLANCVTIDAQELGRVFFCMNVDSTTSMTGLTITGGSVLHHGGGMFISSSSLEVVDCIFRGNLAHSHAGEGGGGGGVYCTGLPSPTLTHCTFFENTARCGMMCTPLTGGGMCSSNSNPTLIDCIFCSNDACNGWGGGLACLGDPSPSLINCTFSGNAAAGGGGGIYSSDSSSPAITRCIIAFSQVGEGISGFENSEPILTCCNIFGNEGGDQLFGVDGGGNFSANPRFCNQGAEEFHLHASSPCLPENNDCGVLIGAEEEEDCDYFGYRVLMVPGDYGTIGAALTAASFGDTVLVSPGTYQTRISLPWSVVLRSTSGAEATVIDGAGEGTVVLIGSSLGLFKERSDHPAVLEGFTITGGAESGIRINQVDPIIRNCIITDNSSSTVGGGILCFGSSPIITGCTISQNSAGFMGGGVGVYDLETVSPTFTNCTIVGNSATEHGGGIFFSSDCNSTITSCTLSGNSASQGGGIYFRRSSLVLTNCIIAFSQTGESIHSRNGYEPLLTCCDIFGNEGGDWVELIADQIDQRGNFSADPCFCDAETGDFRLCADSWCLPGNHPWGCDDLVGAFGVGCDYCGCGGSVGSQNDSEEGNPEEVVPFVNVCLAANPNPFNPQTTITFSLERSEWAEIGVYELTGKRVAVLADRAFDAGTHSLTWSGRDVAGHAMPSGTYLVRLETEDRVEARKVMLIR